MYSKNKATVLGVVVSSAAYIFAVQRQGGVSVRVLDYASGRLWYWVAAARTIEKYLAMFGPLDWRCGAPPNAFCRLALGCVVLAKAGVGIDHTTLSAVLPSSKERAEDNFLVLDDAQYLTKQNTLRELLVGFKSEVFLGCSVPEALQHARPSDAQGGRGDTLDSIFSDSLEACLALIFQYHKGE